MKVNKKVCKGQHKAKGFSGCGDLVYRYRYGLCKPCYFTFLRSTDVGNEIIKKSIIQAKKEVKRNERKEKRKQVIELMSKDKYRSNILQRNINKIIRHIDKNFSCITDCKLKGHHAGHFISVGSNRQTALNLHNIHLQNGGSNGYKGGQDLLYYKGLINRYGQEYAEFCDQLRQSKQRQTKEDYIEANERAIKYYSAIKKIEVGSIAESISLRNNGNIFIGLYENNYSEFNIKKLKTK